LLYGPWSYGGTKQFTVQIGFVQIMAIFGTIWLLFKKRKENIILLLSLLLMFTAFSIFLMLPYSNIIWSKFILLQNFQFPWRFLALIVFTTAAMGALVLDFLPKKINKQILTYNLILFVIVVSWTYMKPKAYQQKPESFYTGIYESTTDTGESAPIWSIRFMEHRPRASVEVISGKAKITQLSRSTTEHKYRVEVAEKAQIKENTLYFPGWSISANNIPLGIEFQNQQHRGLMLFNLDKGAYDVLVKFEETKFRLISDILSVFSVICLVIFLVIPIVKRKIKLLIVSFSILRRKYSKKMISNPSYRL
jgi:hypothetical protein